MHAVQSACIQGIQCHTMAYIALIADSLRPRLVGSGPAGAAKRRSCHHGEMRVARRPEPTIMAQLGPA